MSDQLRRRSVGAPAARSTLLTILGEYVLHTPGGVWQEALVAALETMGYKTQTARQALARSTRQGWLTTERIGRRARMHLTEPTAALLRSGAGRIYSFGAPWSWDGRWLLVVVRVPEQHREVRHQVRTRLAWAGLGSLGGGLWLTPHVGREQELRAVSTNGAAAAEILSFEARIGQLGDPHDLIAAAWDLPAVAQQYEAFLDDFRRLQPSAPADAFRAQTRLVHAWRKFPFLDPDLPADLLPTGWPRAEAYDLFQERHARWQAPAREHFAQLTA